MTTDTIVGFAVSIALSAITNIIGWNKAMTRSEERLRSHGNQILDIQRDMREVKKDFMPRSEAVSENLALRREMNGGFDSIRRESVAQHESTRREVTDVKGLLQTAIYSGFPRPKHIPEKA